MDIDKEIDNLLDEQKEQAISFAQQLRESCYVISDLLDELVIEYEKEFGGAKADNSDD